MQTSQRWPIGTTGALGLAFLLITVAVVEIGLVLQLVMCRFARLSYRHASWSGLVILGAI